MHLRGTRIRTITVYDLPMIYELGSECFDWTVERVIWSLIEIAWFYDNHRGLCFVAEQGDKIVGFVLASTKLETGYIGWIAVAPDHRRCGIGEQLLTKAVKELRRIKRIRLVGAHVRANESAERLFRKCSFSTLGQVKVEMVLPIRRRLKPG